MNKYETRDEPMDGSPLCDAEGRHAWVWTWPIEGGEGSVGQCSLCGQITTAERDAAARAELSRLRGVVEAVQALADEWDEKRRPGMVGISRALRAALAPVSSSGEVGENDRLRTEVAALRSALRRTERNFLLAVQGKPVRDMTENLAENAAALALSSSGEAESGERDAECVARWPECVSGGYDPRCCRYPKSCSCGPHSPAPVPSGGQADGEGEWVCGTCGRGPVEHGWLESTCVYRPLWKPAARPVLSREALRGRLDGHWPIWDFGDNPGIVCDCGC